MMMVVMNCDDSDHGDNGDEDGGYNDDGDYDNGD
jgi:hypothetical protein